MKKTIVLALVTFIFLLTNCNSGKKETNSDSKVVQLNTADFKQKVFNFEVNEKWKYEGSKPVIIDFYTTWCGPCKQMAPIIDGLANEYDGKIVVYKVDIDQEKQLAQTFGIQSIPTFLFIPVNGQPQAMQGAMPKESFVSAINDILLKN